MDRLSGEYCGWRADDDMPGGVTGPCIYFIALVKVGNGVSDDAGDAIPVKMKDEREQCTSKVESRE